MSALAELFTVFRAPSGANVGLCSLSCKNFAGFHAANWIFTWSKQSPSWLLTADRLLLNKVKAIFLMDRLLSVRLFQLHLKFLIMLLLWPNFALFLFLPIVFPTQNGKVAIVTGGAKGIGYHTVKHLARLGMHVIIGTVIISKILIYIFCLFLKVFSVSFMQYFLSSISISMEEERWRGEESTFSTNENLIYILFCKILKKSVFFLKYKTWKTWSTLCEKSTRRSWKRL